MNRTIGGIQFENIAGNWIYTRGKITVHLYQTRRGWRIVKYKTIGRGKYMSGQKLNKILTVHEALTARECVHRMFGGIANEK